MVIPVSTDNLLAKRGGSVHLVPVFAVHSWNSSRAASWPVSHVTPISLFPFVQRVQIGIWFPTAIRRSRNTCEGNWALIGPYFYKPTAVVLGSARALGPRAPAFHHTLPTRVLFYLVSVTASGGRRASTDVPKLNSACRSLVMDAHHVQGVSRRLEL